MNLSSDRGLGFRHSISNQGRSDNATNHQCDREKLPAHFSSGRMTLQGGSTQATSHPPQGVPHNLGLNLRIGLCQGVSESLGYLVKLAFFKVRRYPRLICSFSAARVLSRGLLLSTHWVTFRWELLPSGRRIHKPLHGNLLPRAPAHGM